MFTAQVIKIFSKSLQNWTDVHISQIARMLLQRIFALEFVKQYCPLTG